MLNVMAALPNIGGALCSTPQSLADAHYWRRRRINTKTTQQQQLLIASFRRNFITHALKSHAETL